MKEKDKSLPLIPLRGGAAFPHTTVNLDAGRAKSVRAVKAALKETGGRVILVAQRDPDVKDPLPSDMYETGTLAQIVQIIARGEDSVHVVAEGMKRIRIKEFVTDTPHYEATFETKRELRGRTVDAYAYMRKCRSLVEEHFFVGELMSREGWEMLSGIEEPVPFLYTTAHFMEMGDRQKFLETDDVVEKYVRLHRFLEKELEIAKVEKKITKSTRKVMDRSQKEYYLREKIKAIQNELGDNDDAALRNRVNKLPIDEESKAKLKKDIERNAKMPSSTPDYGIMRNYIDYVLDLPWGVRTEDNDDLANARKVLDEDHYGLEKIKERIVEFLAVRRLTDSRREPILCLVGPPGVGKTSVAKSVARALGRKYVRMSLGGIHDEAEIRGHRKTYVGALPGRIISGMKTAGSMNPVFLMDEIDKLAGDYKGDPSSALLEVLDPEQNFAFRDNYLEIPFDLSNVIFITTANDPYTIPPALRDRMEIIEMNGYTPDEKLQIARRHLVPKQLKAHGLEGRGVEITDDAIDRIIGGYTLESGVRALEKEIAHVLRKVAVKVVEGSAGDGISVSAADLTGYLGVPKYTVPKKADADAVGAATGLAWTANGGDILTIEVSLLEGRGDVILTGHLGKVMKESARTAISYIHAHEKEFGIPEGAFRKKDIHIHVPEGAIPKDGPSAGITIATALLSALTNKGVRNDVAMTGEITLSGRVLPIGGLKEKSLAAARAGIDTVLIPSENGPDLTEIPESIREKLNFVLVDKASAVFENSIRNA